MRLFPKPMKCLVHAGINTYGSEWVVLRPASETWRVTLRMYAEASSQWISMNVPMSRMRRERAFHRCISSALQRRHSLREQSASSDDSLDQVKLTAFINETSATSYSVSKFSLFASSYGCHIAKVSPRHILEAVAQSGYYYSTIKSLVLLP